MKRYTDPLDVTMLIWELAHFELRPLHKIARLYHRLLFRKHQARIERQRDAKVPAGGKADG